MSLLPEPSRPSRQSIPTPSTDVRADYGSADWVSRYIVFNIGGNKYRLIVSPNFAKRYRTFFVKFIGTHKEYDALNLEDGL